MRLLLVEDKIDFAANIERVVRSIPDCELVWTESRDGALEKLTHQHFDLVILDRRIPTADGVLDDHQEHGWRIFQTVKESFPGTCVWFLTATEDVDFAAEMNNDYGRVGDIHGCNEPEQMYLVCWKRRVDDCVRRIREFASHRAELNRIAIRLSDVSEFREEECNIVRLFARGYHGVSIDVSSLNGGLTRSRVLKVVVRDANNAALMTAAAKVSLLRDTKDEEQRYRTEIVRLRPGGFPQLTTIIEVGAGNYGGLFYGMVGETVQNLFQRINAGASVAHVPASLHRIEEPWYQNRRLENVPVAQIRRKLIGDVALGGVQDQLHGIDIASVETRTVRAGQCSQHGDLHCANVVFAQGDEPMLIDFGDAGVSFSAVDPITLELSTIFHAQHTILPGPWPTEEGMTRWLLPDQFTDGCPFAPFIIRCREWALEAAASPEEVVALAYAYAVRQLRYEDTDKLLARTLIRACIEYLVK